MPLIRRLSKFSSFPFGSKILICSFFDGDDVLELSAIMSLYEYLEDNSDLAVSSYMLFVKLLGRSCGLEELVFLAFVWGDDSR